MSALRAAKRFLRAPAVIVGEVVAIAVTGVLGAAVPQASTASGAELARLRELGPVAAVLIDLLGLDHIFQSAWFVAITLLASASLSVVVAEQLGRLRAAWSQRLTEAHFLRAPFRTEFERPAGLPGLEAQARPRAAVHPGTRLGLAGSPIFHVGLLLVVVAGVLRALFAVDALVDLIEGETLPPAAEAWGAQWPGLLAAPFRLDYPVRLDAVRATRYEAGDLKDLRMVLSLQRTGAAASEEVAINHALQAPGGRLFLGSDFGPAALIEWHAPGGPRERQAVLLTDKGKDVYEASASGPDEMRVYLRARLEARGNHPRQVEVRVMRARALLFAGLAAVGEDLPLPDGNVLGIRGLPFWARLRGTRDPALWLAYIGFALVLVGATIIFAVVKVDTCVIVTPAGDKERVFVALRAQRFVPLFEERFRRLVCQQGGVA